MIYIPGMRSNSDRPGIVRDFAGLTPISASGLLPGDVVVVRTPWSWFGWLIRLGARLRHRPATVNHVVIVTGQDGGEVTGVEARPGGVGYVNVSREYQPRWMIANIAQPKTWQQRGQVVSYARRAIGAAYDWTAVGVDALESVGVPRPDVVDWSAVPPREVMCSALACWAYAQARLPHPQGADRWCTPGEWAQWIQARGWCPS